MARRGNASIGWQKMKQYMLAAVILALPIAAQATTPHLYVYTPQWSIIPDPYSAEPIPYCTLEGKFQGDGYRALPLVYFDVVVGYGNTNAAFIKIIANTDPNPNLSIKFSDGKAFTGKMSTYGMEHALKFGPSADAMLEAFNESDTALINVQGQKPFAITLLQPNQALQVLGECAQRLNIENLPQSVKDAE
jgi:hypothetical protein